jgi:hypothetical protein
MIPQLLPLVKVEELPVVTDKNMISIKNNKGIILWV